MLWFVLGMSLATLYLLSTFRLTQACWDIAPVCPQSVRATRGLQGSLQSVPIAKLCSGVMGCSDRAGTPAFCRPPGLRANVALCAGRALNVFIVSV